MSAQQLAIVQVLDIEVTTINTDREEIHLGAVGRTPVSSYSLGRVHHLRFKSSILLVLEVPGHLLRLPHHLQAGFLRFFISSLG